MMKKIIILFSILIFSFWSVNASNNKIDTFYNKYYQNLLTKNKSKLEVIQALELLDKKLSKAIKLSKDKNKKLVFYSIKKLNSEKLLLLKSDNLIQKWDDWISYDLSKITNEILILDDELRLKNEFNNEVYLYKFVKISPLAENNYKYFLLEWIWDFKLFKFGDKVFFSNDFEKHKLYTQDEVYEMFENKIDITSWSFIKLENSKYYFYDFFNLNTYSFDSEYTSLEQLKKYWLDLKTSLIFLNDWKYWLVKKFKKIELFDKQLLENISNIDEFMFNLSDDISTVKSDYKSNLQEIKNISLSLTKNLNNDQEKIQIIYKWIVDNITYYENFTDWNKEIFSWLTTFENRFWVCDWYTKLFLYMLSFAWVNDVKIKTWYAFDSEYFPSFWHAWVSIWQKYYDPTFDDPIGWKREEYLYFWIPKDLMYINRFEWEEVIDNLDKKSLLDRKNLVEKKLFEIYPKYFEYDLAKSIKNKVDLWFKFWDKITLETLAQKVDVVEITSEINVMYYFENNEKKYIKSINYYPLTNENLEWILLNYKIEVSKLKIWKFSSNWKVFYWLIYNITLH